MRRSLLTLAATAALGLFATTDASACCHKKAACAEPVACAPAPVECAPAKKHCFNFKLPKFKLGCHKKAECAPACEVVAYEAPAPVYAAPQAMPTAQH
jgi:hypothetical protein